MSLPVRRRSPQPLPRNIATTHRVSRIPAEVWLRTTDVGSHLNGIARSGDGAGLFVHAGQKRIPNSYLNPAIKPRPLIARRTQCAALDDCIEVPTWQ
jgi:hypothetical protein